MNTRQTDIFKYFNQTNSKYQCKFCNWSTSKNATRMSDHIIKKCWKCPKEIRQVYFDTKNKQKK